MEYLKGLIFILITVNIIVSGYLSITEFEKTSPFCLTGKNCEIVRNSQYSEILGIKLAYLGLISFSVLLIIYYLTYKNKISKETFLFISAIGALLGAYFIYTQIFLIKAICSNCIVTDLIAIIIPLIFYISYFKK